jgi:hypothetical protein
MDKGLQIGPKPLGASLRRRARAYRGDTDLDFSSRLRGRESLSWGRIWPGWAGSAWQQPLGGHSRIAPVARDQLCCRPVRARTVCILLGKRDGVEKIRAALEDVARGVGAAGVVLLCFEDLEDEGQWCHRTIFAAWWREQTGEDVVEL